MRSNKKQIIIVIIMMLLVVGSILGFIKGKDLFPKTSVWNNKDNYSFNNEENSPPEFEPGEIEVFNEDKTYEVADDVEIGDYKYKVNSVEKTKKRGNFPTPTDCERLSFDEDGNLVDDNSYVIVNITIKQNSGESTVIYLNSMQTRTLDSKGEVIFDAVDECCCYSNYEDYDKKSYYRVELENNKEYTWDIVYAKQDEYLKYNNLKLKVNRQSTITPENKDDFDRYINIKF